MEFYRENPAQIHRLMPWINRELVVLLCENSYQIQVIMDYLQELFTQYDITSSQFRAYFATFMGSRTDHFIHELLNFAKSPYDMMGYDRNVRYAPYYRPELRTRRTVNNDNEEVVILSDNESNSPEDLSSAPQDLSYSRRRNTGRTEFTISTRLSHSTVIFRGSIEANPSTSNTSTNCNGNNNQLQQASQAISPEDAEVAAHNERALGSNGTIQITRNISVESLSESSSDECEFVLERKPPHLRTPEMVSLNSESDSDVVFVNEEKKTPPSREIPPPGVFEQTKNSSSSESEDNKCLTVIRKKLIEIKNQPNNENYSIFTEPVPSTSTAGINDEPISIENGRLPLRFRFKKRSFKSIYDSSSESEDATPDNRLIPSVQYSNSSTDDEAVLAIPRKPKRLLKRKRDSHDDTSVSKKTPKRRSSSTKDKKENTSNTNDGKDNDKKPKLTSVIVKNTTKPNSFYIAYKNKVNVLSRSESSNSSNGEESSSSSEEKNGIGDTPGWSTSSAVSD